MKTGKVVLIVIGIISIVLGILGLWYNTKTFSASFSDLTEEHEIPYFYPAFYIMSTVCICCFLALIMSGIQFVRLKTNFLKIFIGILVFEVIYFFSIGLFWLIPNIGISIGAATGVANGGLTFQAVILFPLWAPFLARFASKRIANNNLSTKIAKG